MSGMPCSGCMQVALGNLVGMRNDVEQVLAQVDHTVQRGSSWKLVCGRHRVRFLPCMRYNYCHVGQSCCTDPGRLPVSLTSAAELLSSRVKVCVEAEGSAGQLIGKFAFC